MQRRCRFAQIQSRAYDQRKHERGEALVPSPLQREEHCVGKENPKPSGGEPDSLAEEFLSDGEYWPARCRGKRAIQRLAKKHGAKSIEMEEFVTDCRQ